jgi:hypothetical protein
MNIVRSFGMLLKMESSWTAQAGCIFLVLSASRGGFPKGEF